MANITWMINNVGWTCDEVGVGSGGASMSTGYDIKDMISGPRSSSIRAYGSNVVLYPYYGVSNYSTTPTKFLEASHLIVARFDRLVTHEYYPSSSGNDVRFAVVSANGAGSFTTHVNYNPLRNSVDAGDLLGPRAQDLVLAFNGGNVHAATRLALQVRHASATTESWAAELGSVFFSNPWDPGMGPDLRPSPQWTPLPANAEFQAPRSERPYGVEAEISLQWSGISNAKRDELYTYFGGDDCILNWPLFLYDQDSTLWNHKLEHVILADYSWTKKGDRLNDLSCKFYRLRHYP